MLQRRGAEIRAAIVAGFNSNQGRRPQQSQHRGGKHHCAVIAYIYLCVCVTSTAAVATAAGGGSNHNKAHKSSTASLSKPTQSASMFGFINRMESAHTGAVSIKLPVAGASQSKPPGQKSAAQRKHVF